MRKYVLPLLFIFVFVYESLFLEILPGSLVGGDRILVPRFLFIMLVLFSIYGKKNYAYVLGFVFGLLFDVVYTGIIGIYLFMFPLITYIISSILKFIQTNIVVSGIASLIAVCLLELGVYEMNFLIRITDMPFGYFSEYRLLPTVILNAIFIILFIYPLKRFFEKYLAEAEKE